MDQKDHKQNLISAIIPAYNEEKTIFSVISPLISHPAISEVIVIDDGSRDNTSKVAKEAGAKVITLLENSGKGFAMECGVLEAKGNFIFFADADVTGLSKEIIDRLIPPLLENRFDMYVAIRGRGKYLLNKILTFFPILGGERVLTREIWNGVPQKYKKGFQIEIALNYHTKRMRKRMGFEVVSGLRQTIKEKKYGFFVGFGRRLVMISDIIKVVCSLYIINNVKQYSKSIFALRFKDN